MRDEDPLSRLQESVGELGSQNQNEPIAIQTEGDRKPFLNFFLAAQDIDKEDLRLLKKKIAELSDRKVE